MAGVRSLPPAAAPVGLHNVWRVLSSSNEAQPGLVHALKSYLGTRLVYVADSGRSALFLLLQALQNSTELGGRDEVVLPAYTCPALSKVILDAGLRPRWVDLHPHSMEMISDEVRRHAGAATLAIMAVHPFGLPHPLTELQRIAHKAGALLIEDTAQAMGACHGGQRVGTFGDFGLFSLGPGKPLSTGGGGFIVTNQTQYVQILDNRWRSVVAPGAVASLWAVVRLGLIETLFHPWVWGMAAKAGIQRLGESEASWGYRVRGLTNTQAALGQRLLPRLDSINAHRRTIATQLATTIGASKRLRVPIPDQYAACQKAMHASKAEIESWRPIYLRFPVVAQDSAVRDALYQELVRAGIGAGKMYRKTMAGFFPHMEGAGHYPGAQQIVDTILTLPTHSYVGERDLAVMKQVLQRWT